MYLRWKKKLTLTSYLAKNLQNFKLENALNCIKLNKIEKWNEINWIAPNWKSRELNTKNQHLSEHSCQTAAKLQTKWVKCF